MAQIRVVRWIRRGVDYENEARMLASYIKSLDKESWKTATDHISTEWRIHSDPYPTENDSSDFEDRQVFGAAGMLASVKASHQLQRIGSTHPTR